MTDTLQIHFQKLNPNAITPLRATSGAAAFDLYLPRDTLISVRKGERILAPTGIAIAIPDGYAGLILPRSGSAINAGITVLNSPGLIDSDYRGEVKIILVNHDNFNDITHFRGGDRLAQLLIIETVHVVLFETDTLPQTERGRNGFGSTGI